MVIQFSIPATNGCAPCCAPACEEDGTLMDLTLTGITICGSGCAVTADGKRYAVTGDPTDLLGVWPDIPLNSLATITTLEMQAYTDDCVTPDGDPVLVDIQVLIQCAGGYYTLSVQFETPTVPGVTAQVFFTDANYTLDQTMENAQECAGSTTVNVPFIVDEAEVSLAA